MSNAETLLTARRDPGKRPVQLMAPVGDAADAYAVQQAVQARLGAIGGWKVGSSGPDAFTCAPLPASGIVASPARVAQAACPDRGVEAEIALLLGADLPPRAQPYTRDEALAAVASAHPAIELLQSRFQDVDAVDTLSALADCLSHHGLVWGAAIDGWQDVDYAAETVAVMVNGAVVKRGRGNPAGDMGRLLAWLANEGTAWAGGLRAGQWVTTGSWTGKDAAPLGGHVAMTFGTCGRVEATYG